MTDSQRFFGSVLKAVACTRNNNPSDEEYDVGVIQPAHRIRELQRAHDGRAVESTVVAEVLDLLNGIMTTKQVPTDEQQDRLREISLYCNLDNSDADSRTIHDAQ